MTPTLAKCAATWLARKRTRGGKQSTLTTATSVLDRHILPEWGPKPVTAIRRRDVEAWLERAAGTRYSPRTVNGWLHLLQAVVASAYRDLELGTSPIEKIEPLRVPRRAREDPNSLTPEQMQRFLGEAQGRFPQHHTMLFLGFTTGLRFCELTALRWEDIDEQQGALHVCRAQWAGHVGEPKTESSYRTIALVQEQLEALRSHRRQMVQDQHPGVSGGYVFPGPAGGFLSSSGLGYVFRSLTTAAEIPFSVTPHGMRRTFNNLLRQNGIGSVVLHSLTGHSSDAMTERYSVVAAGEQARAVGEIVRAAGGKG